jgi:hypothetical protein
MRAQLSPLLGRLFRASVLIFRHLYQRARAVRSRFNTRPKSRAEALAEAVAALDLAKAESLAAMSWPDLGPSGRSPSLEGTTPNPYISDHGRGHTPGILALIVTEDALKFVSTGTVVAGNDTMRRILLINGAQDADAVKGKLDMVLTDPRGTLVGGGSAALGEAAWMSLLPPEKPGLYPIRFLATLSSGARIEARGLLTAVADGERR